jgi:hypothetical protein
MMHFAIFYFLFAIIVRRVYPLKNCVSAVRLRRIIKTRPPPRETKNISR